MRGELALLRRAIEGLTAEREKAPDYSETLGTMDGRLRRIAHNIVLIAEHPAMKLTPETIAAQIDTAARAVRAKDVETIGQARKGLELAVADIGKLVHSDRAYNTQRRTVWRAAGGAAASTILLCSFLPGMIVREMPASWHLPERMAQHIVGEPTLLQAGTRIMSADKPAAWTAIAQAMKMRLDNRDAIDACQDRAASEKGAVLCSIKVRAR